MTIRHLRLFLEVYRTGNITRAAENLHMTQPTVTRAIQELEGHYGVQLFDRINHRLSVTEAGERLYSHATHTLEAFAHMEQEMEDWDDRGVLRIGASSTIGSVMLPQVIAQFRESHPNVTVKALICNNEALQKALEENELDFALSEGDLHGEQLHREVFTHDNLVLLLPPDSPLRLRERLTLEDLRDSDFLLREKGSVGRSYIDHMFSSHGLPLSPIVESSSTHALVQAVHAGIGITILPEELVRHSIDSGFVATHRLEDIPLYRTHYLVWHKGKYLSRRALELIELCRQLGKKEEARG